MVTFISFRHEFLERIFFVLSVENPPNQDFIGLGWQVLYEAHHVSEP